MSNKSLFRLEPSRNANQQQPRRYYVYAHYDKIGTPFYIGKGINRRAWDNERHALWHRYVNNHLEGKYEVRILEDNLSSEEAEALENEWIVQESDTLVNWINFGRKTDYEALDKFHKLRNSNRELIASARHFEKTDPERAVSMYQHAVDNIAGYAMINYEAGLLGQLMDEEQQEVGYKGELEALNRLTMILNRLGESKAALSATEEYFGKYRADRNLKMAETIVKRVSKAAANES